MGIFQEIAAKTNNRPRTTLSIVPQRQELRGARTGNHIGGIEKQIADIFWRSGVEVAKVLYKKIDARYPERETDEMQRKLHRVKFGEAKNILNEARNDVIEAILPNYEARFRTYGEDETAVDQLVHDLIVNNVFYVMVRTFLSWVPEFVEQLDVETTKAVVAGVADTQSEKLARELKNFAFRARPVIARI